MNLRNLLSLGKSPVSLTEGQLNYLENVRCWADIYSGNTPWQFARKGGLQGGMRKISALGAARSLCSEMAALCFSQQIDIAADSEQCTAYIEKTLQENGFWRCFPLFLERMFAEGAGIVKVYSEKGRPKLDFLPAQCFVPTQYDEKGVYGGFIISCRTEKETEYVLLEEHRKEKDGYLIRNKLFRFKNGSYKETDLEELYPDLAAETFIEGLEKPLFTYFRPAGAGEGALGKSVFSAAVDTLKSLDVVFDSLEREFVLGRKRIIVPCSAIRGEYDRKGNLVKYFDPNDEVYQAFSADDNEELKIIDNSAELRVEQHTQALTELLDLLCMQVGLSQGALSYHGSTAKTAAEVISRNSKTYRTKTAHQQLIREGLLEVIDNLLLMGMKSGEVPCTHCKVTIVFADSVAQDNSQKIDNALKLYNAGIISKERAVMEIYGIDKSQAEGGV